MRIRTLILAVVVSTLLGASLAASEPLPKAEEVLKKAVARAKWEKKAGLEQQWAATQRSVQEKLAKDGRVEETTERLFQPVSVQGKAYSRLVAKNGKPLSADDQKKEAERERKFREATAKKQKDPEADDDDDVEFDEALISRYNFAVIQQDTVGGRPAFELTFLPRPGVKLPEKKRMDRILNRLEGRVWIDSETYALVKLDMHLTEPTTLMAGLGSVRSLDFLMEMAMVAPDVFAPTQVTISFEGRRLFSGMRVKQKAYFSDYRKVSELAEAK